MSNSQIFWLIVAVLITIYCNVCLYLCTYGTKNTSKKYYEVHYAWQAGFGCIIDIVLIFLFVTQIKYFNNWLDTL